MNEEDKEMLKKLLIMGGWDESDDIDSILDDLEM